MAPGGVGIHVLEITFGCLSDLGGGQTRRVMCNVGSQHLPLIFMTVLRLTARATPVTTGPGVALLGLQS